MAERIRPAPAELKAVQDVDPFIAPGLTAVDCSATTLTRPAGMVGLLAVLEWQGRQGAGRPVALVPPQSHEVTAHWQAAGVVDALREFCLWPETAGTPAIPQNLSLKPLVKCARFRSEADCDRLSVEMEDNFITALSRYASLSGECCGMLGELTANTVYHADNGGGFALAQYCEYAAGPALELAVADAGIGIRNSLAKNPAFADIDSDCAAIKQAITEGVTSVGDKYRGLGLAYVADNVRRQRGRTLTIRSGNGIIILSGDGLSREAHTPIAYPGTAVSVIMPR